MLLRGAQACGLTSSQRRYVLSGDPEGIDLKGFGWNFENLKLVEISFFIVFFLKPIPTLGFSLLIARVDLEITIV